MMIFFLSLSKQKCSLQVSATLSFDPAMARAFADMGFQMVAAASDTHFLLRGAASVANGFADLRG